jgi:hypothetical protein
MPVNGWSEGDGAMSPVPIGDGNAWLVMRNRYLLQSRR